MSKKEIVNVLMILDTESTERGAVVYHVTNQPGIDGPMGTREIMIHACKGEKIRWRAIATDLSEDVEIIQIKAEKDDVITKPKKTKLKEGDKEFWEAEALNFTEEFKQTHYACKLKCGKGTFTIDPTLVVGER